MISKEGVQHIAKLARIELTEKEVEQFQKELSSILDYFSVLKKVDVSKVEPMTHSVLLENVVRMDKARRQNNEVLRKLMEAAPQRKDRFFKIKSILNDN
ncbi:Asp-tRNA(Asn)/Glu-tRNA(Gln) amidotransferase subunit GatC [Patescibacteria group bacterium]|nr:Asp-tRNA(Asn)/Glu-tRNA(Gln) amidotransferase subunit GatC [Patescibacteria group bacterium]